MSNNDPTHWHERAKETRVLAEQMDESVSKEMMRRIAEDYERLARTVEQRAKHFPSNWGYKTPVMPAEARQIRPSQESRQRMPPKLADQEIPSFLKQGPATAEEVGAAERAPQRRIEGAADG